VLSREENKDRVPAAYLNPSLASAGVIGLSESASELPSSECSSYRSMKEMTSSLKNVCASLLDVDRRFGLVGSGSSVIDAELDGKPNSTASSNFCGDARYCLNLFLASGSR